MDYKNLLIRISVSILILFIYYIFVNLNYNYLIILGLIIYIFILYEIIRNFKKKLYFLIFYLLLSFLLFYIYIKFYFNLQEFNFLILIIILFDTTSYLIGTKYGKNKLFVNLSPNKTLEGLIGGIVTTNFISFLYLLFFYKDITLFKLFFINFFILISFFGDLIQSYVKRKNKIKDSSNYLPGHGGFFDRFDSFIFCIIFLSFYNIIT